jgi:hypothetical protein
MLRLPHFLSNWLTVHEVVSLMHYPTVTPGSFLVLISVRGWVDPRGTVLLEELGLLKNSMIVQLVELINRC